jgi:methyl-accepting chemotaxis protein
VQEIAAASGEQSDSVGQITSAMHQLSGTTQQTASASEQLSATAEELSAQAVQLQELIGIYRLDDESRQGSRAIPRLAGPSRHNPATRQPAQAVGTGGGQRGSGGDSSVDESSFTAF